MNPLRKLRRFLDRQREEIARARLVAEIREIVAENNHRTRSAAVRQESATETATATRNAR